MTGRLLVSEKDVPLPAHTHAVLSLEDGREVRFVDPRRFGRLTWLVAAGAYAGPGAEPMTIWLEEFAALFKGRKLAIKAALLNQSLLHGVGNIYADESLFRAGIRPTRQAGRLTKEELTRLRKALQEVLKRAIKLGGSSVSDYVDAEGMQRVFPDRAQGVWAGRGAMPGVWHADQEDCCGWAWDALLCDVPEVGVIGVGLADCDSQRRRVDTDYVAVVNDAEEDDVATEDCDVRVLTNVGLN